ncbi:MAG: hypothetical protein ACPGC9_00885 [Cytophagales bacterium]
MSPKTNRVFKMLISFWVAGCFLGEIVWLNSPPAPRWQVIEVPKPNTNLPASLPKRPIITSQTLAHQVTPPKEGGADCKVDSETDRAPRERYRIGMVEPTYIFGGLLLLGLGVTVVMAIRYKLNSPNPSDILNAVKKSVECELLPKNDYGPKDYETFLDGLRKPKRQDVIMAYNWVHAHMFNRKARQINQHIYKKSPHQTSHISIIPLKKRDPPSFGPVWTKLIMELNDMLQQPNNIEKMRIERFNQRYKYWYNVHTALWGFHNLYKTLDSHAVACYLSASDEKLRLFETGANATLWMDEQLPTKDEDYYPEEKKLFEPLKELYQCGKAPQCIGRYLYEMANAIKDEKHTDINVYLKTVHQASQMVLKDVKNKEDIKNKQDFLDLIAMGMKDLPQLYDRVERLTQYSQADHTTNYFPLLWHARHENDQLFGQRLCQCQWQSLVAQGKEVNKSIQLLNEEPSSTNLPKIKGLNPLKENEEPPKYTTPFFPYLKYWLNKLSNHCTNGTCNTEEILHFNHCMEILPLLLLCKDFANVINDKQINPSAHCYELLEDFLKHAHTLWAEDGKQKKSSNLSQQTSLPLDLLPIYTEKTCLFFIEKRKKAHAIYNAEVQQMLMELKDFTPTDRMAVLNQNPVRKTLRKGCEMALNEKFDLSTIFPDLTEEDCQVLSKALAKFDEVKCCLERTLNPIHVRVLAKKIYNINKTITNKRKSILYDNPEEPPTIDYLATNSDNPAPLGMLWLCFIGTISHQQQTESLSRTSLTKFVKTFNDDLRRINLLVNAYEQLRPAIFVVHPIVFFSTIAQDQNFTQRCAFLEGMEKAEKISNECYARYGDSFWGGDDQGISHCLLAYLKNINDKMTLNEGLSDYINHLAKMDIQQEEGKADFVRYMEGKQVVGQQHQAKVTLPNMLEEFPMIAIETLQQAISNSSSLDDFND